MNDRFNFRIWHVPLEQMHYNDFIVTATGYMAKIYQQDDYMMKFNQEDLEFDKQCILMQCTGLKDKNGKLIYELDYVRYSNNKYKVEVDKFLGISLTNILNGDTIIMDDIVLFNCEVIGNEFESNTKI